MKKIVNKKLKIAVVSDAIYPYNKGGKEKRIYELHTRLAKAGHDVHIYCMNWWDGLNLSETKVNESTCKPSFAGRRQVRAGQAKKNDNYRFENGIHLHAISKLYPLYSGKRRSIKQAIMFALACLKLLREDFDIIDVDHMPHFVLFTTKLVTILKRKKLYATWNEVWGLEYWNEYLGKLGVIAYIIEWLSARMPDKIIAVSEHTKSKLIKDLKVQQPIEVIPNGIDFNEIQKVSPSRTKSDVIFAGRLLNHKNVDVLIESISHLKKEFPKIKVLIIGEGPEKMQLQVMTKKLGLESNITFLGFLQKHTQLYSYIKSSKVFVFPSTREGFGIVAIEANACGIPVITVNHKDNATKTLIKNGENGYITSLNSKTISAKTSTLLNKRKSNNYKKAISQYDWSLQSINLERLYNYEY